MDDFRESMKIINKNAVEKGFWDTYRKLEDVLGRWEMYENERTKHDLHNPYISFQDVTISDALNILGLEIKDIETLKAEIISSKIALIHSEISEALEGLRKNNFKFTEPKDGSVEEEFADTFIRMLDVCEMLGMTDIAHVIKEKHLYNTTRQNKHGKVF